MEALQATAFVHLAMASFTLDYDDSAATFHKRTTLASVTLFAGLTLTNFAAKLRLLSEHQGFATVRWTEFAGTEISPVITGGAE